MIFEWDENKNRVNKVKHGIDFESAITVFDDPLIQSRVDDDGRWQTIGNSEGCMLLLFVAHLQRCGRNRCQDHIREKGQQA